MRSKHENYREAKLTPREAREDAWLDEVLPHEWVPTEVSPLGLR